jgi:hypothetical protein
MLFPRFLVGLVLGLVGLWLFCGARAQAATGEPILFLGIQRHTAIDRVATEQLMEYLSEHGESVLKSVALHDNERRCRHPQCLEALGLDQRAALVMSGDVSSTGPNNTLRVQVHLFDVRRRGSGEAQAEMENLCIDCDETKLAILLATTAANLIQRHRVTHPNPPPPLPAAPKPPAPTPAQAPAQVQAQAQAPVAPSDAPPPASPTEAASPLPLTMAIPPAPTPPVEASPPPAAQQSYPVPPPDPAYAPPILGPEPMAPVAPPRKGLSRNRTIIAGVFGAVGIGSLVVAAVMTGLDRRLAPDYSYSPGGLPCSAPENIGKACVLSTVGLYAPLYAVGGLLVGGMVLTLALPESRPRPPPPPQDGTP